MPKSEIDEFLETVSGDKPKADPFLADDSDPLGSKDSKQEGDEGTKDEDGESDVKDEKPLPFHKDPKVQRFIEKEIAKRIGTKPEKTSTSDDSSEDELTETLIEIIGNDTPQKVAAVKKFRSQLGQLEEKGAERALSQIREQAEAEKREETEAQEQLVEAFDSIEEEYGVFTVKERNDFVDFIRRVSPKDADGDVIQYPDIQEAYKVFKSGYKPSSNTRAKDLASRSMSRSSDATSTPQTGRTWKDIDKIFSKLSS